MCRRVEKMVVLGTQRSSVCTQEKSKQYCFVPIIFFHVTMEKKTHKSDSSSSTIMSFILFTFTLSANFYFSLFQ